MLGIPYPTLEDLLAHSENFIQEFNLLFVELGAPLSFLKEDLSDLFEHADLPIVKFLIERAPQHFRDLPLSVYTSSPFSFNRADRGSVGEFVRVLIQAGCKPDKKSVFALVRVAIQQPSLIDLMHSLRLPFPANAYKAVLKAAYDKRDHGDLLDSVLRIFRTLRSYGYPFDPSSIFRELVAFLPRFPPVVKFFLDEGVPWSFELLTGAICDRVDGSVC